MVVKGARTRGGRTSMKGAVCSSRQVWGSLGGEARKRCFCFYFYARFACLPRREAWRGCDTEKGKLSSHYMNCGVCRWEGKGGSCPTPPRSPSSVKCDDMNTYRRCLQMGTHHHHQVTSSHPTPCPVPPTGTQPKKMTTCCFVLLEHHTTPTTMKELMPKSSRQENR